MEAASAEGAGPRLGPHEDAARKRAAVETYARYEGTLRGTAGRYSLCPDDADEALQRALEVLLRKAPTADPRQLVKWMQTVVKHEALAVRSERERVLAGPAGLASAPSGEDWVALLPSAADGPQERLERREAIGRSREALQALKPQELRALTLLAEGYSYAEIGEITCWSRTKVNRCLAEGRERFRRLVASNEDGSRCKAMSPLLSAFCDGEASPRETAELREHLRACASCRATLRAYRAAPAAAAALVPALPLRHSLWERVQDAVREASSRLGGSREAALPHLSGGAGLPGVVKLAAVCVAAAGGAGACVATGLLPAPVLAGEGPQRFEQRQERRLADLPRPGRTAPAETTAPKPAAAPESRPGPEPSPASPDESEPVPPDPAPVSSEAIESAPPPAPEPAPAPEAAPEPAPVASTGASSPAGEFGP